MMPLSLGEIAAVVRGTVEGDGAVTVTAPAVLDGRQAEPGGLFIAFAGEHADGHDYAGQAGAAGAVTVLGSRPSPGSAGPDLAGPDCYSDFSQSTRSRLTSSARSCWTQ